ncbi:MAG TPA: ATP-binding protein, partial [Polyangia bacterium]
EPLVGDWDPGRLAQAASNLVSNAIKYAPSGAIRVAVRLEGDEAVLSVADEGPGITPEEREAIVQPYVRLGRGETRQGVGLGLTIVAAIAAAHGGRLIIDSALGQGSTFTLRLPRGA